MQQDVFNQIKTDNNKISSRYSSAYVITKETLCWGVNQPQR